MPAEVTVKGLREYVLWESEEEHPTVWSEWMDPERMSYLKGWLADHPDAEDPGTPMTLAFTPWQAQGFVETWHGEVWVNGWVVRKGEYSTDCYRTGRESKDVLFVDAPEVVVGVVLAQMWT